MPVSKEQTKTLERTIMELTKAIKDLASQVKSLRSEISLATHAITSRLSDLGKQ